jgi:hypothetical protein
MVPVQVHEPHGGHAEGYEGCPSSQYCAPGLHCAHGVSRTQPHDPQFELSDGYTVLSGWEKKDMSPQVTSLATHLRQQYWWMQ